MEQYVAKIIHPGDESGNEMVVKFRLPSGLEIFGLPTKNFYGGHWDLGPTWNYAVMADKPFLVDSGRFGQGKRLVGMMNSAGISAKDLDFVLISHSHEDHDGGLAELVETTHLRIKAHAVYDSLIRQFPETAPAGYKQHFPAKCWHCPMPESFWSKNCLEYHRVLKDLTVDRVGEGKNSLANGIWTYHLAGHSPDCLAVLLGDEAIIVGDVVLPDISPWPTRRELYSEVAAVIGQDYPEPEVLFGLQRYIKSLKKLDAIALQFPDILVLPAHRFYYNDRWNGIQLSNRVRELIRHHIERCGAILDILCNGPKTAEEIATEHFDENLLEGFGSLMAANEIISHCELLMDSGDVVSNDGKKYSATGKINYIKYIEALEPNY